MVFVKIDTSTILVEPLKHCLADELMISYQKLLDWVRKAGSLLTKHIMDNKVSEALKEAIEDKCKLELVPPGCHQRNFAEVAIKTFKEHFIAILAGLPQSFPTRLWCETLPQAKLTPKHYLTITCTPKHFGVDISIRPFQL